MSTISLRLLDFKITNQRSAHSSKWSDNKEFVIQMFGLDEAGKSYSLFVKDFHPFFYIKVGDNWNIKTKERFLTQIQLELSKQELTANYQKWKKKGTKISPPPKEEETVRMYVRRCSEKYTSTYHKSITECKIIKRHTLYGFDANREYKFILLRFKNTIAMNKVKNFWYDVSHQRGTWRKRYVLKTYAFQNTATELYEARLPPLLRYFHIQKISPSGWITIAKRHIVNIPSNRKTTCDYEYTVLHKYIHPIPNKETPVPIKICSFDIECSSSHGDFPVAKKSYTKFVRDIIAYWGEYRKEIIRMTRSEQKAMLIRLLLTAFGYDTIAGIHTLYPKHPITQQILLERFQPFLQEKMYKIIVENKRRQQVRNQRAKRWSSCGDDEEDEDSLNNGDIWPNYINKTSTFLDYLNDTKKDITKKLEILDEALSYISRSRFNIADIKGDTITFIGTTFITMGQKQPFLNHGVCLGSCNDVPMENARSEIVCCNTEKDLLLEWTAIMRQEQPDVIIGYNIFGFDWKFLCERAEENRCFRPECPSWMGGGGDDEDEHGKPTWFSLLSRNKGIFCRKMEKEIRIASGTHLLTYVKIDGIIQIDLYNYFRREVNLPSYKLQDVASHFIGDYVTKTQTHYQADENQTTTIHSGNLMGLQVGNYVIFEVIDHSTDLYKNGCKFEVTSLDEATATFIIKGEVVMTKGKKLRWGLGKDDVTPQDLFQAFSDTGTIKDRTKIARYCFQDCNLVQHLARKNDILTGMSEIASICSIPIDFVVMRGQGIKLLSFIAQQCRQKRTLMPNIDKVENDGSYEGAICLQPKKNFYTEDPVAVVDYASLYPSSMISENISHDSKVWTKEYDLQGNLILETGNKEYDNLPEYEYVDIEYDTYEWISPDGKKKEVKVKVGTKICRFAQFPDNKKAIMPSIAQELLAARKATRIMIKYKTLTTIHNQTYTGLLHIKDDIHEIRDAAGKTHHIPSKEVKDIQDTYDDFMKNVFDKRQLGFKITANSLYGQCGARTSAFYEKDIAASTTATGRKLLLYAQRIIEEIYQDRICETSLGTVVTKADCIYGDTDSCFFTFNLADLEGKKILGKQALMMTIELAQEAGVLATKMLKLPHDLEYEKTFWPFLLLSKKRYVGMQYEHNPNKCKRKSMGIVLKRRDNAPIVKDIYGGNIDILMKERDIQKAMKFTKTFLDKIVKGNVDMRKLIISKALRGFYKNPRSIAHKVLAERMGDRDPGNKPAVGSRIPYIYIQTKTKEKLQGNRIEHPDYIRKHNLKPDYSIYITNQIMKPIIQIFALVLEKIPQFKSSLPAFKRRLRCLYRKYKNQAEKLDKEETKLRNAAAKKLIFGQALRQAANAKNGQKTINYFFG